MNESFEVSCSATTSWWRWREVEAREVERREGRQKGGDEEKY